GMRSGWQDGTTHVVFDEKSISPKSWTRGLKKADGRLCFIPAHRALLLAEGWPAPFLKLNADTPVVARLFSQNLYQLFSGRGASSLSSVERILKQEYRNLSDETVFHGGTIELEKDRLQYRLRLVFKETMRPP